MLLHVSVLPGLVTGNPGLVTLLQLLARGLVVIFCNCTPLNLIIKVNLLNKFIYYLLGQQYVLLWLCLATGNSKDQITAEECDKTLSFFRGI
jgi:hypothetical protein